MPQQNTRLPNPLLISTKLGSLIPHFLPLRDWTNAQRRELIRRVSVSMPEAILRSGPTKMYNCHGLTFANRRAWVENVPPLDPTTVQSIEGVLEEDGYRPVNLQEVEIGDVAAYREDPDGHIHHTGIVVQVDSAFGEMTNQVLLIMSKWGQNGEFLHTPNVVPPGYGSYMQYWTERN